MHCKEANRVRTIRVCLVLALVTAWTSTTALGDDESTRRSQAHRLDVLAAQQRAGPPVQPALPARAARASVPGTTPPAIAPPKLQPATVFMAEPPPAKNAQATKPSNSAAAKTESTPSTWTAGVVEDIRDVVGDVVSAVTLSEKCPHCGKWKSKLRPRGCNCRTVKTPRLGLAIPRRRQR